MNDFLHHRLFLGLMTFTEASVALFFIDIDNDVKNEWFVCLIPLRTNPCITTI